MRTQALTLSLAAILVVAADARADVVRGDVRAAHPSTDPSASLVTESPATPGKGDLNVTGWVAQSYRTPLLSDAATGRLRLDQVTSVDVTASMGIRRDFALGLQLPVLLFPHFGGVGATSPSALPRASLGDVAVTEKLALVHNDSEEAGGGFGLAVLGRVAFPTGAARSFVSDRGPGAALHVLADYSFLVANVQATVGVRAHGVDPDAPSAADGVRIGAELPWTVGARMKPALLGVDPSDRHLWELGLRGSLPLDPVRPFGLGGSASGALTTVSLAISDRVALGHYRDTFLLSGVEVGLVEAVGLPRLRVVLALGWAPRSHDRDGDGIADDVDQCPDIPEDIDGFEDSDGCPDLDNDNDGILDTDDACPNVAGVASTDPKRNGCPANGDRR